MTTYNQTCDFCGRVDEEADYVPVPPLLWCERCDEGQVALFGGFSDHHIKTVLDDIELQTASYPDDADVFAEEVTTELDGDPRENHGHPAARRYLWLKAILKLRARFKREEKRRRGVK